MTDNHDHDAPGRYSIHRKSVARPSMCDVFVSRILRSPAAFEQALIEQGMSATRARQVMESVPCFVKRGVAPELADRYKAVFEQAGASVNVLAQDERADSPRPRHEVDDGPGYDRVEESSGWAAVSLPDVTPVPELGLALPAPQEPEIATPADESLRIGSGSDHISVETIDDPPSSRYARSGARALERESFRIIPPPPPKPWLRVHGWKLVLGALVFLAATYCYGCTQVMQASVGFRQNVDDVNRRLENITAKGDTLTHAEVVYQVRLFGHEHGVSIGEDDVTVDAQPLGQVRMANGRCRMANIAPGFHELPESEKNWIYSAGETCSIPEWILEIHIRGEARWGLASREIDMTRYTYAYDYDPEG